MHASASWLNSLLSSSPLSVEAIETALTNAGFPIESRESLVGGDTNLDVEITSNRGDCLSLIGLAREIAAVTGTTLKLPTRNPLPSGGEAVSKVAALENRVPEVCPRFTLRVIKGVKVGPSPAWLVKAIESVGQRSINNIVDATNYISFELGNPSHAFDLNRLAGNTLIVRYAGGGEKLTTLDGKSRTLAADELVVADQNVAQSLAGVMGGKDSEVTDATTDVAIEVATWDPVTIRRASRRHALRTDASHRFERIVPAATVEAASERLTSIILEVAGGAVCDGVLIAGAALLAPKTVTLRAARLSEYLGYSIEPAEAVRRLESLGFAVSVSGGILTCTVPYWRTDINREVDLIEEVGRIKGLDAVPTLPTMGIIVKPPQENQRALRELATCLNGLGFFETVTFTFINPKLAKPFLHPTQSLIEVDDDRRKADPALRPSVVPSLLACRRANQDAKNDTQQGIRLFETSLVFSQEGSASNQMRMLSMLMDCPAGDKDIDRKQAGVRAMRGALEAVVRALGGPNAKLVVESKSCPMAAFDSKAHAHLSLNGRPIGHYGLLTRSIQDEYGLERQIVAAEVDLEALVALFPPLTSINPLPAFPAIERDISFIVSESATWGSIESLINASAIDRLEAINFVYTYRGKQIGQGKKSVTARLRFRDSGRTLRHEEVDPQVASVTEKLKKEIGAEVRQG